MKLKKSFLRTIISDSELSRFSGYDITDLSARDNDKKVKKEEETQ